MAFPYLTFSYHAFIPQSVGKTMSQIFQHHPRFNRQDMRNYNEFADFLRRMDARGLQAGKGGNWIAEPPPYHQLLATFAMTNDGEFDAGRGARRHTTGKVSIEGKIDLRTIGHMSVVDPPIKVPRKVEGFQCKAAIMAEMRSTSYPGTIAPTGRYVGMFEEVKMRQSIVTGRKSTVNKSEGLYISRPGTSIEDLNDTTILWAKAAGSYPFIWATAPDIDMQLTVKLRRQGDLITINFEGKHDQFPAYELMVNGVRRTLWDAVGNKQLGPGPINLNSNYLNTQVRTSYTMYQRMPYGYKPLPKNVSFGLPKSPLLGR